MTIELLQLKNDYTFKRVFGHAGNENITISLLNSILKEPVTNINLDRNKILEEDLYNDKLGILDIRAKINNSIDCDIEMQLVNENNVEKRILFYLSKMYTQNINKGQDYSKLNKCIAILFTDFSLKNLKSIHKYMTKWNLREEKYNNVILTDSIEIYIIELSKVQKYSENSKLDTWVNFIIKSGDIDMENADEAMKQAKEVLEEISNDEHERYLADLRQKYNWEKKGIEEAGFERGVEEGSNKKQLEIAKKLKDEKVDISIIIKTTGLTKEEIEKL